MIGYKNERYLYFGRVAARLDDLVNYVPARFTGACMVLALMISNYSAVKAIKAWQKYAHLHPSPNGGIPESIVAGALGIRLGGDNWYHGQKSFRAYMGEGDREIEANDIRATIKIMYVTTFVFAIFGVTVLILIGG
ncbi:MAG: cobalamin biosynthesis protein, partial [Bacillota bacterium]|nr:cobalamin biosynthesis protein [Bacillota bacterium]